jgi:hypothetical protein
MIVVVESDISTDGSNIMAEMENNKCNENLEGPNDCDSCRECFESHSFHWSLHILFNFYKILTIEA